MTTWEEARTPRTAAEYRDDILAGVGELLTSQAEGSPDRDVVEGEARALEAESDVRVAIASTASPTTIVEQDDSWVDAKVSWFDLDSNVEVTPPTVPPTFVKGRFRATKAVWLIPLITEGQPITINSTNASGIQLQAETGAIFQCTQQSDVKLELSTGYKGNVEFTARLPGLNGNVAPGQINAVILGPAILFTNGEETQVQTVSAREKETNGEYILRALGRWAVRGAGWVRESFDYLVPTYGNGPNIAVTRWVVNDANPNGPGTVEVIIANASGPATVLEVTTLQTALNGPKVKPVGSGALTVVAAVSHVIAITATLQTDGTILDTVTKASAEAAIGALGQVFPLGIAKLTVGLITNVLMGRNVVGASIRTTLGAFTTIPDVEALRGFPGVEGIDSTSFAADVVVGLGEVLQLSATVSVFS